MWKSIYLPFMLTTCTWPTHQINKLAGCQKSQTRAAADVLIKRRTRQTLLKIVSIQNQRKKVAGDFCVCACVRACSCHAQGFHIMAALLYVATRLTLISKYRVYANKTHDLISARKFAF